jgi:moderate conductance mechanosensitive channel
MMSSALPQFWGFTAVNALHLLGIIVLALVLSRLLRAATNSLIKSATTQSRAAQQREQQTRELAGTLYSAGSKCIWGISVLTALPEFGISVLPAVMIGAAATLALGIGAHAFFRDSLAGFCILFEDQFVVGDTIQTGEISGRVEQITLRRTVVRDTRGALVTIANGEVRAVANLSRDWSQAFVDIEVAAETPLEKMLQALETAAAELRSDA